MPFDPTLPIENTPADAAQMRAQFNGLHSLITSIPAGPQGPPGPPFADAVVDGVTTLDPGENATVSVSFDGTNVHFSYGIPRGMVGAVGGDGPQGPPGAPFGDTVVDGVTTLDPGQDATVQTSFNGNEVHFSFGIPRGAVGAQGPPFAAAVVDATNTLNPGVPATVSATFDGTNVHFTFGIPQGVEGPTGSPGEVTTQQLTDAIATTSANSNAITTLGIIVSDPPTQGEMQAVVAKLDELINALRRV